MTNEKLKILLTERKKELENKDQIRYLTKYQIRCLTKDQISWLTKYQIDTLIEKLN